METRKIDIKLSPNNADQYVKVDGVEQRGVCGIDVRGSSQMPMVKLTYEPETVVNALAPLKVEIADVQTLKYGHAYRQARREVRREIINSSEVYVPTDPYTQGLIIVRTMEILIKHP